MASLIRDDSRAFLVYGNYEALLDYNCAHSYALSVALLADRLARCSKTARCPLPQRRLANRCRSGASG